MCTKKKYADGKPGIRFAEQEMAILVGALKVVQIHNTFTSEYNKTVVSYTGIDTYQIGNNLWAIEFDFIVVRL